MEKNSITIKHITVLLIELDLTNVINPNIIRKHNFKGNIQYNITHINRILKTIIDKLFAKTLCH